MNSSSNYNYYRVDNDDHRMSEHLVTIWFRDESIHSVPDHFHIFLLNSIFLSISKTFLNEYEICVSGMSFQGLRVKVFRRERLKSHANNIPKRTGLGINFSPIYKTLLMGLEWERIRFGDYDRRWRERDRIQRMRMSQGSDEGREKQDLRCLIERLEIYFFPLSLSKAFKGDMLKWMNGSIAWYTENRQTCCPINLEN